MKNFTLILFLFLLIISCGREDNKVIDTNQTKITICTFNLEWLGDGINDRKDRTEEDYKNIAEVITKTGADIFALQEVENERAMEKVCKYLKDFSFILGSDGGAQNLAVLFRKTVSCKFIENYIPLAVQKKRTRPGLLTYIKIRNFDFYFLVVHLKSSSHWDNTQEKMDNSIGVRLKQAEILSTFCDSIYRKSKEKDLIIAGDFNDTPVRKKNNTLFPILNNKNLQFITFNLKSCKFRSMYTIDHIIASSSAGKRLIYNSERAFDFNSYLSDSQAENVSDHCPVLAEFDISAHDND